MLKQFTEIAITTNGILHKASTCRKKKFVYQSYTLEYEFEILQNLVQLKTY